MGEGLLDWRQWPPSSQNLSNPHWVDIYPEPRVVVWFSSQHQFQLQYIQTWLNRHSPCFQMNSAVDGLRGSSYVHNTINTAQKNLWTIRFYQKPHCWGKCDHINQNSTHKCGVATIKISEVSSKNSPLNWLTLNKIFQPPHRLLSDSVI